MLVQAYGRRVDGSLHVFGLPSLDEKLWKYDLLCAPSNFAFTISHCDRHSELLETLEPQHSWPSSSGRNLRSRLKRIDAGARCNEQALRDEMPNTAVHACRQSKTKKKGDQEIFQAGSARCR